MKRSRVIVASAICLAFIIGLASAEIWPLGEPIPNSLLAGVTQNGLNFITDIAETYLQNEVDIIDIIMSMNPLYDGEPIPFCHATVNATGGSYDPIQLTIQLTAFSWMDPPPANALFTRVTLNNFRLNLNVSSCLGSFWARVDLDARFEASINIEYVNIPTPHIDVRFQYLDVFFDDFDLTCEGGWDILCSPLSPILGEVARNMLREKISEQLYTIVNDMLSQLPLSYEVEIPNPLEEGESEILKFELANFLLQTAPSRNTATFVLETAQYFEGIDDCVDLGGTIGSLYTPSQPPVFYATSPGGYSYHMAVAVSDDMVNQLFYSAYSTGLLCISMTLEELFPTGELPKPLKEFSEKVGEDEGIFWLLTYPHKEPIFTVGGSGGAHLTISLEDLDVAVYTYLCERWARFFAGTIDFTASASVNVSSDTCETGPCVVLDVTLNDYELGLDVIYTELSGFDEDTLLELVNMLLEQYIDEIIGQYGHIEVPALEMPGGIYLLGETVEIRPIGSSSDFLGIYANFETAR